MSEHQRDQCVRVRPILQSSTQRAGSRSTSDATEFAAHLNGESKKGETGLLRCLLTGASSAITSSRDAAISQYSSASMMVMTRSVTDGSDGSGE
jgi:hypothetical protein